MKLNNYYQFESDNAFIQFILDFIYTLSIDNIFAIFCLVFFIVMLVVLCDRVE